MSVSVVNYDNQVTVRQSTLGLGLKQNALIRCPRVGKQEQILCGFEEPLDVPA